MNEDNEQPEEIKDAIFCIMADGVSDDSIALNAWLKGRNVLMSEEARKACHKIENNGESVRVIIGGNFCIGETIYKPYGDTISWCNFVCPEDDGWYDAGRFVKVSDLPACYEPLVIRAGLVFIASENYSPFYREPAE